MAQGFIAGGNISPSRFVKATTPNRTVVQCTAATDNIIGISGPDTHLVGGTIGGVTLDDGFHAVSGLPCQVFLPEDSDKGQLIMLELGGTVAWGDTLTSDGSGKGITTVTDANFYGARALSSGVAGQLIHVQVITGMRS